jgi:3',5'-cyclic AMP phosphodiesterase CpdA
MITAALLRIAVITDIHLAPAGVADGRWNNPLLLSRSRDLLEAAVAAAAAERVDHVLVLGDAAGGDEASAERALQAAARTGVPVCAVPGNRDVAAEPDVLPRAARRAGVVALDAQVRSLAEGVAVRRPSGQ